MLTSITCKIIIYLVLDSDKIRKQFFFLYFNFETFNTQFSEIFNIICWFVQIIKELDRLNNDSGVHGIIVQVSLYLSYCHLISDVC